MDTLTVKVAARRTHRRHNAEFKKQVIEACLHPGVSVAAVALANGLNANMLRKWVRAHGQDSVPVVCGEELPEERRAAMVPVTVAAIPAPSSPAPEIRVDLRRGGTMVQMAWPLEAAASLGQCLRELLG
jgi:transposase-like protein